MAGIAIVEQFPAGKLDNFDATEATLRIARPKDSVNALIERGFPGGVFETGRGGSGR